MTLLALTLRAHTGVRLAELGFLAGAIGGVLLLLGGMTPFGRPAGMTFSGIAFAVGFVLLFLATRWGQFHLRVTDGNLQLWDDSLTDN